MFEFRRVDHENITEYQHTTVIVMLQVKKILKGWYGYDISGTDECMTCRFFFFAVINLFLSVNGSSSSENLEHT